MAVNLKKANEDEKALTNVQLLKELMDEEKFYSITEIIELLKQNNISKERISLCVITLGYIMDGFVDETMEKGESSIYYHNGKFSSKKLSIDCTLNEATNENNNQNFIANQNDEYVYFDNTGEEEINVSKIEKNTNIYENMDEMELLYNFIYIDNDDYSNDSMIKINHESLRELLKKKYNLSKQKVDACMAMRDKIIYRDGKLYIDYEGTVHQNRVNEVYNRWDVPEQIIRYYRNDKVFYFFLQGSDFYYDARLNYFQKYIIDPKTFTELEYNPNKDLYINGLSATNEDILNLIIGNCFRSTFDVYDLLRRMIGDVKRIQECYFHLLENSLGSNAKYLRSTNPYNYIYELTFRVRNMNLENKKRIYGKQFWLKTKDKIRRVAINEFFYNNMVVTANFMNEDDKKMAIPARNIYVIRNQDSIHYCFMLDNDISLNEKIEKCRQGDPNVYDKYPIYDLETWSFRFHLRDLTNDYDCLDLASTYKSLIDTPPEQIMNTFSSIKRIIESKMDMNQNVKIKKR